MALLIVDVNAVLILPYYSYNHWHLILLDKISSYLLDRLLITQSYHQDIQLGQIFYLSMDIQNGNNMGKFLMRPMILFSGLTIEIENLYKE